MKKNKRFAFTLAEVLITLGIIGVVAALTIPTLVANYQIKSWDTAASNFESAFGEALKVMNTQQTLAKLGTTERFVSELQKHMKTTKICDSSNLIHCFPAEINGANLVVDVVDSTTYQNSSSKPIKASTILTADGLGQKDWGTNTVGILFANGVSAILAYNPKCSANPFDSNAINISGGKDSVRFGTDCVAMLYDTSANANPNELNKDIRTSSAATIGDGDCIFKINGKCATKIVPSVAINKAQCESLKSTLKISNCPTDNDFWAGVANTCGGTDKMLTADDLVHIASYVYDTDYGNHTKLSIKSDRVKAIGLSGTSFNIWSGLEQEGRYATYFIYGATFAGRSDVCERYYGAPLGICVSK